MSNRVPALCTIGVCLTACSVLAQSSGALPNATVRAVTTGVPTSCPKCELAGMDMSGRKLSKVNFAGADLSGANLSGAQLDGAILSGANLSNAILDDAVLSSTANGPASLIRANLSGTKFRKANVDGVQMQFVKTDGADFTGTELAKAIVAPAPRTAGAGAPDWVCGGVDAKTLPSRVYVSPQGASSAPCGTSQDATCGSIKLGISTCSGAGCAVLVAYGEYPLTESLALRDGVSVYGGCLPADQASPAYVSVLDGPPGGLPVVTATVINSATTLRNFHLNASAPSQKTGNPSIALLVSNSNGLNVVNSELLSDVGGEGDAGGSGAKSDDGGSSPGQDGGKSSCGPNGGAGGEANVASVDVEFTNYSCSSNCLTGAACSGGKGHPGFDFYMANPGQNVGGSWCVDCPGTWDGSGGAGSPGETGHEGSCGHGGTPYPDNAGSFDGNSTWRSSAGYTGVNGGDGGGGGGGSSAGFLAGSCAWVSKTYNGGRGGGGGGGGCGGVAGKGGQQGGGSFPIVAVASSLTLTKSRVIPGQGGKGGVGGPGGAGGKSGAGAGGVNPGDKGGTGGSGGDGGSGGGGGGGAGGNGGPAVGAALVSVGSHSSSITNNSTVFYPGRSGPPGSGGTGALSGSRKCTGGTGDSGASGLVADTHYY